MTCRILVPPTRDRSVPPAVEVQSPNHQGIIELFIFKKLWKQNRSYPFVRDIYICKGVSLSVPKRRRTKSLETLINGEGKDFNLCNNLALVYVLFLMTSHNWLSPASLNFFFFLVFSWRWYLRWWLGPLLKATCFPGSLQYIQELYMLLNFCGFFFWFLFFILIWVLLQRGFCQEPKRVNRKLLFLPYTCWCVIENLL